MVLMFFEIVVMAVAIDILCGYIIRNRMEKDIYDNIKGVCYEADYFLKSKYNGDYYVKDGELYAGDNLISEDTEFLDSLKDNFGVEATIFYGNIRYMTTILDSNGKRLVGTEQKDENIVDTVFKGNIYTSDAVIINNEQYYGIYIPLYNNKNEVCGMVFSGVPCANVKNLLGRVIWIIIGVSAAIALVMYVLIVVFSQRINFSLNEIKKFMDVLSHGKTDYSMDPKVLKRQDEIGDLARYSIEIGKKMSKIIEEDHLTEIYNRRCGEELLEKMFDRTRKDNGNMTVVMCDVDYFKQVNDKHGHYVGDDVLIKIASVFRNNLQDKGIAVRWGGEEFILAFEGSISDNMNTILRIQEDVKKNVFKSEKGKFSVTMTFGLAETREFDDLQKCIKEADAKLYIGKNGGRDAIIS